MAVDRVILEVVGADKGLGFWEVGEEPSVFKTKEPSDGPMILRAVKVGMIGIGVADKYAITAVPTSPLPTVVVGSGLRSCQVVDRDGHGRGRTHQFVVDRVDGLIGEGVPYR